MAGGPYANVVPCSYCERQGVLEPAERIYEGSENDVYRCPHGHTFGIHWRQIPERSLFERPAPGVEPPLEHPSPVAERERIAVAAYYRYLARRESGAAGDALGDWLAAEQAMRDR